MHAQNHQDLPYHAADVKLVQATTLIPKETPEKSIASFENTDHD